MNDFIYDDEGAAMALWIVLFAPVLIVIIAFVAFGARFLDTQQRAFYSANEAARRGVLALDEAGLRSSSADPAADARTAACGPIDPGVRCTAAVDVDARQVEVTLAMSSPGGMLRLIGVDEFDVEATGSARAARGASAET